MVREFRKALINTCKMYGDKVAITYMRDDNTTTYTSYKAGGTRTRSGKMGTFMNGVATAAIETGTPIIPVAIIGTFRIWPVSRRRPKFSLKRKIVKVIFGKPIYPIDSDISKLTKAIELKVKELYKGDYE